MRAVLFALGLISLLLQGCSGGGGGGGGSGGGAETCFVEQLDGMQNYDEYCDKREPKMVGELPGVVLQRATSEKTGELKQVVFQAGGEVYTLVSAEPYNKALNTVKLASKTKKICVLMSVATGSETVVALPQGTVGADDACPACSAGVDSLQMWTWVSESFTTGLPCPASRAVETGELSV